MEDPCRARDRDARLHRDLAQHQKAHSALNMLTPMNIVALVA
jgi:hypothetical protein